MYIYGYQLHILINYCFASFSVTISLIERLAITPPLVTHHFLLNTATRFQILTYTITNRLYKEPELELQKLLLYDDRIIDVQ